MVEREMDTVLKENLEILGGNESYPNRNENCNHDGRTGEAPSRGQERTIITGWETTIGGQATTIRGYATTNTEHESATHAIDTTSQRR